VLAGKAIRGIALGVGVTALVQAVLGGMACGAGVPAVAVLSLVMFILCLAQLGVFLVLMPPLSGSTEGSDRLGHGSARLDARRRQPR